MGVSTSAVSPVLAGPEGELLLVRIRIPAAQLERLLDSLAVMPFPINPELQHGYPLSTVEFPAYASRAIEVRRLLDSAGLRGVDLAMSPMLAELRAV